MGDLISRKAALDKIDRVREIMVKMNMRGTEHILVHYGRRIIEELPSAEKHGTWETEVRTIHGQKIPFFACSVCGKNADDEYRYCPTCGARMDLS